MLLTKETFAFAAALFDVFKVFEVYLVGHVNVELLESGLKMVLDFTSSFEWKFRSKAKGLKWSKMIIEAF